MRPRGRRATRLPGPCRGCVRAPPIPRPGVVDCTRLFRNARRPQRLAGLVRAWAWGLASLRGSRCGGGRPCVGDAAPTNEPAPRAQRHRRMPPHATEHATDPATDHATDGATAPNGAASADSTSFVAVEATRLLRDDRGIGRYVRALLPRLL